MFLSLLSRISFTLNVAFLRYFEFRLFVVVDWRPLVKVDHLQFYEIFPMLRIVLWPRLICYLISNVSTLGFLLLKFSIHDHYFTIELRSGTAYFHT